MGNHQDLLTGMIGCKLIDGGRDAGGHGGQVFALRVAIGDGIFAKRTIRSIVVPLNFVPRAIFPAADVGFGEILNGLRYELMGCRNGGSGLEGTFERTCIHSRDLFASEGLSRLLCLLAA